MSTIVLRNTKGSALTFTEVDDNFTNLNTDKLENVSEDTTPQLGGDLDVNGQSIVSASNGNIAITPDGSGKIILDGLSWPTADGSANYFLKTDGAGNLGWADPDTDTNTTYAISAETDGSNANLVLTGSDASEDRVQFVAGSNITLTVDSAGAIEIAATDTGIANVVDDTTPQLGGNLDVNGNSIVSVSNGNITLAPNGTGKVIISGDLQIDGTTTTVNSTTLDVDDINITLAKGAANGAAANGGGITLEGPTTAATITYADADDSWNFNKKTAAPELQVDNVNVNGNTIVSTDTDGDLNLTPNGTGDLVLDGLKWPQADGSANYVLKTDGAGQLGWVSQTVDTNTTYSISAVTDGSNANLRLTGSDASTDDVQLVAGSNITLTVDSAGAIEIAAASGGIANVVEDTTPQLGGNLDCQGYEIQNPVLEDYRETVYSLGSTDSPTLTVSNGNVQTVTITSGLSLPAFSDAATGQTITLIVTGSGTVSGTGAYKFASGNTTLTSYSVVSIFYDGTTYWTSVATDFQ